MAAAPGLAVGALGVPVASLRGESVESRESVGPLETLLESVPAMEGEGVSEAALGVRVPPWAESMDGVEKRDGVPGAAEGVGWLVGVGGRGVAEASVVGVAVPRSADGVPDALEAPLGVEASE